MAQDVNIGGVEYHDVPAVEVPTTAGGTATFIDETMAVLYEEQATKTDEEKQQVRTNIGAAAATDLSKKQDVLTAGFGIAITRTGATEKELTTDVFPCTLVANGDVFTNYRLYGNTIQNGTPSLGSPAEISGVGNIIKFGVSGAYTDIILTSPLYKIGDAADYIDKLTGTVHRSIRRVNLATLSWTATTASGKYRFNATLPDYAPNVSAGRATNVYLDRFVYAANDAYGVGFAHSNKSVYIYVSSEVQTVQQLTTWLASNPSYIVYPATTETIEDIDLPTIHSADGENSIDFDAPAKPSSAYFKYMQGSGGDVIISVNLDAWTGGDY